MYLGIHVHNHAGFKIDVKLFIMTKNTGAPLPHIKSSKGSCSQTIIFTIHKKISPVMILDLLMEKYRRVQGSPSTLNI